MAGFGISYTFPDFNLDLTQNTAQTVFSKSFGSDLIDGQKYKVELFTSIKVWPNNTTTWVPYFQVSGVDNSNGYNVVYPFDNALVTNELIFNIVDTLTQSADLTLSLTVTPGLRPQYLNGALFTEIRLILTPLSS